MPPRIPNPEGMAYFPFSQLLQLTVNKITQITFITQITVQTSQPDAAAGGTGNGRTENFI